MKIKKLVEIMMFFTVGMLLSCSGPSEEYKEAVTKAKSINQFDTIDEVITKMGSDPTETHTRDYSGVDFEIISLVWDYGTQQRVYTKFYNGLACEVLIGKYQHFRAELKDHLRDPRYDEAGE